MSFGRSARYDRALMRRGHDEKSGTVNDRIDQKSSIIAHVGEPNKINNLLHAIAACTVQASVENVGLVSSKAHSYRFSK